MGLRGPAEGESTIKHCVAGMVARRANVALTRCRCRAALSACEFDLAHRRNSSCNRSPLNMSTFGGRARWRSLQRPH